MGKTFLIILRRVFLPIQVYLKSQGKDAIFFAETVILVKPFETRHLAFWVFVCLKTRLERGIFIEVFSLT